MKAVIYARFSPRKNADASESNDFQLDKCRQYCEQHSYPVKSEHEDKALSGADADRPGLWQAIEALGKGTVLVVYKLDRLARDVYLSELLHREARKAGSSIEAVEGGSNGETPEQTMIRQVLQVFAEYERKIIGIRTKQAMRRLQANGKTVSSRPPYGMEFDPESAVPAGKKMPERMRRCPEEQSIIKRIIAFSHKGLGLRAICRALAQQGIRHRGGVFYHAQVKSILERSSNG